MTSAEHDLTPQPEGFEKMELPKLSLVEEFSFRLEMFTHKFARLALGAVGVDYEVPLIIPTKHLEAARNDPAAQEFVRSALEYERYLEENGLIHP
jgi:hypothetical protein